MTEILVKKKVTNRRVVVPQILQIWGTLSRSRDNPNFSLKIRVLEGFRSPYQDPAPRVRPFQDAFCFSVSRPFPPSKFSHLEISEPQESLRHAKNRQKDYLNPSRLTFLKIHHASNDPLTKRQLERVAKTTTAFRESNTKRWTLPLRTHRERLRYELC